MKKIDVKTLITLSLVLTLNLLTISSGVAVMFFGGQMQMFHLIFTLFTNICTAAVTYYFTRKSVDSEHAVEVTK